MSRFSRVRDTITGRFTRTQDAQDRPATTVTETSRRGLPVEVGLVLATSDTLLAHLDDPYGSVLMIEREDLEDHARSVRLLRAALKEMHS